MNRLVTDEERRLGPEEDVVVAHCHVCGGEIYDGEVYGLDRDGEAICRDCLEEEWSRLPEWEKFELLSYEVIE